MCMPIRIPLMSSCSGSSANATIGMESSASSRVMSKTRWIALLHSDDPDRRVRRHLRHLAAHLFALRDAGVAGAGRLLRRIGEKTADIAVLGCDVAPAKVAAIHCGESFIKHMGRSGWPDPPGTAAMIRPTSGARGVPAARSLQLPDADPVDRHPCRARLAGPETARRN